MSRSDRKAEAMFAAIAPLLDNLSARWKDEREYEDFAEYKAAIEAALTPHAFMLTNITSNPFVLRVRRMVGSREWEIDADAEVITIKPLAIKGTLEMPQRQLVAELVGGPWDEQRREMEFKQTIFKIEGDDSGEYVRTNVKCADNKALIWAWRSPPLA
jgi:hypothetical protein